MNTNNHTREELEVIMRLDNLAHVPRAEERDLLMINTHLQEEYISHKFLISNTMNTHTIYRQEKKVKK